MARHTSFTFTAVADPAVERLFARHAGAARFGYNQCRALVTDALDAKKQDSEVRVPWTRFDLINAFNTWKRSEAAGRVWTVDSSGEAELLKAGLVWRHEVCAQVFEEAAVDLSRGLDAWSKSRRGQRKGRQVGFPRRHKKGRCRDSFRLRNKPTKGRYTIRVGTDDDQRVIRLPVIGPVKVREDTRRLRRLLKPGEDGEARGRILFVTVRQHRGRWKLVVNLQAPDFHEARRHDPRQESDHGSWRGIDVGQKTFAVAATASGERTYIAADPPRPLTRSLPKLRKLSKAASRKQTDSKNRRKADRKLNRLHGRVADQRKDYLHRQTSLLVKTHDRYCLETLAAANLARKAKPKPDLNRPDRGLPNGRSRQKARSRAIADLSWAEFSRQLAYKAAWAGGEVVTAPRFFASTKTCSKCGWVWEDITLEDRTYTCQRCLHIADRDLNAATNLAVWAEKEHRTTSAHAQTPDRQAGGRAINACGGNRSGRHQRDGETVPATPARGKSRKPAKPAA